MNGLTGRYRQSVIDYTGEDHKRINGWLRRGQTPDDKWVAARTKDLDAVLAKNALTTTTVLTRTIDVSAFKVATGADLTGSREHSAPKMASCRPPASPAAA